MRITYLRLKNWRNFARAEFSLEPRTFIVGPNASGKSNLLDALRFIRDISSERGGLQWAVADQREGFRRIRSLFTHGRNSHIELEVHCRVHDVDWQYELRLESDDDDRAVVKYERVENSQGLKRERPILPSSRQALLRQTHLEQSSTNGDYEALVNALQQIRYTHLVPQLLRTTRLQEDRSLDAYGSTFLKRLYDAPQAEQKQRLKRINDALKGLLPFFDTLRVDKDRTGNPHLVIGMQNWRKDRVPQNETQLSDGTLRVIALLWEVQDGDSPLLLEEPELSLHQRAIEQLPELFAHLSSNRQVILTTHAFTMFSQHSVRPEELVLVRGSTDARAKSSQVLPGKDMEEVRAAIRHEADLGRILANLTQPPNAGALAEVSRE